MEHTRDNFLRLASEAEKDLMSVKKSVSQTTNAAKEDLERMRQEHAGLAEQVTELHKFTTMGTGFFLAGYLTTHLCFCACIEMSLREIARTEKIL